MNSCEAIERALHLVDVREIHADIVIPTALAVNQPKTASRVGVARADTAQVDHRSQILLVLECSGGHPLPLKRDRDTPGEVGRREFDRVSRHTRAYRLLNQHDRQLFQGPSATTV